MLKKWRTLNSKVAFRNRWVSIRQETVETHTGRILDDYFINEGHDVVIIFALTTTGQVVLVRQYKHGAGEFLTEIPAGGLEANETPEIGARRELKEETGYSAAEFVLVATLLRSPTNSAIQDYIFLARDAYLAGPTAFDETENIETHLADVAVLRKMLVTGEINDGGCVAACYRVLDYLNLLSISTIETEANSD